MIGKLVASHKTHDLTAPARLEAVDARHLLVFRVGCGNAPEIVLARALLPRPADRLPLQGIIGHKLALLIARRSVEIAGSACAKYNENTGQQLAFVLGKQETELITR